MTSKPTVEPTGRRAFICEHKDHEIALRVFLVPGETDVPSCPKHGPMARQSNYPYASSRAA